MIRKTTALTFLLFGSVMVALSQTNRLRQEVKISGEISQPKPGEVYSEFPRENYSDVGILSPLFSDFDQTSRSQKPSLSTSFPSFKQLGTSGKYFSFDGFATHNPFVFDFNNIQTAQLNNRLFIFSKGQKVTHVGLGEYTQLSSSLGWRPSNKLTVATGGFVCRQFAFATLTRQDIIGASIKTRYNITNKVEFNSWGQYMNSGGGDSFAGFNTLFPHTGIGSSISVKIKNLSKIEGGAEYQYNESTKVWNLESQGKLSLHF